MDISIILDNIRFNLRTIVIIELCAFGFELILRIYIDNIYLLEYNRTL